MFLTLPFKDRYQRIVVAVARLVTLAGQRLHVTPIQDMVYLHIQMMGMESVGRPKSRIRPSIMQVIPTHGAIGKRPRGVVHVTHHDDVFGTIIQHLTDSLGLPRMGTEAIIQLLGYRLDATLAVGWNIHRLDDLAVILSKA